MQRLLPRNNKMKYITIKKQNDADSPISTEVALLKHCLEERIKLADSPDAVWHDAADVFAKLEAHNANQV